MFSKKRIGEHHVLEQAMQAELEIPRDRNGTFEPKIVAKGQTRWTGLDGKILSMYARGMTTRDIQGHLEEIYGVEVSPTLVFNVTEAVQEECEPGTTGRWNPFIRSSIWMRCMYECATTDTYRIGPCMWPSGLTWKAIRKCSACSHLLCPVAEGRPRPVSGGAHPTTICHLRSNGVTQVHHTVREGTGGNQFERDIPMARSDQRNSFANHHRDDMDREFVDCPGV